MAHRREQIRPRAVDLAEIEADGEDGEALMGWPPAARVVRQPAPQVGSTSAGRDEAVADRHTGGAQRVAAPKEDDTQAPTEAESNADARPPGAAAPGSPPKPKLRAPLLGEIRERGAADAPRTGGAAGSASADQATDENGKPMSAFRRSRLMRQQQATGKRAPDAPVASAPSTSKPPPAAVPSAPPAPDPTRDPGGGAPPDQIRDLLASVSEENADRVAKMSYGAVEEELEDAAAFFGKDALERLKARRGRGAEPSTGAVDAQAAAPRPPGRDAASSGRESQAGAPGTLDATSSSAPSRGWPGVERRIPDTTPAPEPRPAPEPTQDTAELESIRARYFPDEPAAVNPALEWTVGGGADAKAPGARFGFEGEILTRPFSRPGGTGEPMSDASFLAGLHHHGDEQHAPGYTVEELLHLARSAVPSQRALSLRTLGRIAERNPQHLGGSCGVSRGAFFAPGFDIDTFESLDKDAGTTRARILLSARWLLEDRHRSVRIAALQCLCGVMRSVSVSIGTALAGIAVETGSATNAAPYTDWHWLAAMQEDQATQPRCTPPFQRTEDASYLELVQRHWASALVRVDTLPALARIAEGDMGGGDEVQDDLLHAVDHLVQHSVEAASALPRFAPLVQVLVRAGCTAFPWPLQSERPQWPKLTAAYTLLRSLQSSREAAEALVADGALDPFLRYIVLPPGDGVDENEEAVAHEHALLTAALLIFTALARYGLNSGSVRETWDGLQKLGAWAVNFLSTLETHAWDRGKAAQLRSIAALFTLLEVWTHNAVTRPRTHGDLGANWPTVCNWITFSAQAVAKNRQEVVRGAQPPMTDVQALYIGALGSALGHVATWLHAAQTLEPALLQKRGANAAVAPVTWAALAHGAAVSAGNAEPLLAQLLLECSIAVEHRHDEQTASAVANIVRLAGFLGAYAKLADGRISVLLPPDALPQDGVRQAQVRLLRASVLDMLTSPVFTVGGAAGVRPTLLASCMAGIGKVPTDEDSSVWVRALLPEVLSVLGLEDAPAFAPLARTCVEALGGAWDVLSPFYAENARCNAPDDPPSLFDVVRGAECAPPRRLSTGDPLCALGATADQPSDPLTEASLWCSAAAGLPVRRDWPLLPLDDLLHSAEARVFNRPGALPTSWDYSEAEIVRSALDLAERMLRAQLGSWQPSTRGLPTAPAVWLGMMKVFLLEQDQAASERFSGAATGRDLYAQPEVETALARLGSLADELAQLPGVPSSTLEDATTAVSGTTVSFYQTYTDLVGLYDAVSLGHAQFARILVPPLAMTYAPDYRRLLWSDYYPALRSVRLAPAEAPVAASDAPNAALVPPEAARCAGYLWPLERDEIVLGNYVKALVSGHITRNEQPLLYAIALHHVAGMLWTTLEPDVWLATVPPVLQRSVFRGIFAESTPAGVREAVLRYVPCGDLRPEVAERREAQLHANGAGM